MKRSCKHFVHATQSPVSFTIKRKKNKNENFNTMLIHHICIICKSMQILRIKNNINNCGELMLVLCKMNIERTHFTMTIR